jgi:hypothetical protein
MTIIHDVKSLIYIVVFIFSASKFTAAQTSSNILVKLQTENKNGGIVKIVQSENIKKVLLLHLEAQRNGDQKNGYRICIFRDSGQEALRKAENVRSVFMSMYRNVQPYKSFNTPFYSVDVGDFKTKSEAMKFLKTLERTFPNAYIVSDVISDTALK